MNQCGNYIWHCNTIACLESLSSKSRDLIVISVRETGAYSPDYDDYNEDLFYKIQQLCKVVSDRGIVSVEADSHDLSLTKFSSNKLLIT
jgi:hypothetical protein